TCDKTTKPTRDQTIKPTRDQTTKPTRDQTTKQSRAREQAVAWSPTHANNAVPLTHPCFTPAPRQPHVTLELVFQRVIWIVLDSVGAGAMPDAAQFGPNDPGADTLGNIERIRGLHLPNLAALGLGNLKHFAKISPALHPTSAYGRCALASPGKDTTTGHWEMVGIHLEKPFPLYPNGFPADVIE